MREGGARIARGGQGGAEGKLEAGIVGLESEGFAVVGDGLGPLLPGSEKIAEGLMGVGEFRICAEGGFELALGDLGVARAAEEEGVGIAGAGVAGTQSESGFEVVASFRVSMD